MDDIPGLQDKDLNQRLLSAGTIRDYEAEEWIFRQGDSPGFLPIVLEGRVKVFRFPSPGKEVIMNVFGDGEFFAIPPMLNGTRYPANAAAMDSSRLLLLFRDQFEELLAESEDFSRLIMARMSGLLHDTTRSINILATASPEIRIAQVLIWLAEKEKEGPPYKISLRRQDIAEIAGLATETTIRTIRRLADRELLEIRRGKVIMDDVSGLRRFCSS